MKLIAYRRVSTKGQVDGWGLPAQKQAIQQAAKEAGHRIIRWESDEGISGVLDETGRPGLFAALKAIENGEADGFIVAEIGRLARELHIQEAVLAKAWSLGGSVFTADSGEILRDDPSDPMRTFVRQVMGAVMQLEKGMITKRLRNGKAAKKASGGYVDGSPPFGTRSVDGVLVVDEAEQATAARIRELHAAGLSSRQIAGELNSAGLTSKRGGAWSSVTVLRVINRS